MRFTFDNNYFNDIYQGIPVGGYNKLFERLLDGVEVRLDTDFFSDRAYFESLAGKVVYTGPIDQYYDYRYGKLEYRTVKFEQQLFDMPNYQGVAVMNYTDAETPYTRIIEHKHFDFGKQDKTVISKEFSSEWKDGSEPYYPINNDRNNSLYLRYKELADKEADTVFGGRLAEYKYYDMHHIIQQVLDIKDSI